MNFLQSSFEIALLYGVLLENLYILPKFFFKGHYPGISPRKRFVDSIFCGDMKSPIKFPQSFKAHVITSCIHLRLYLLIKSFKKD